jgi:hypothetical protein
LQNAFKFLQSRVRQAINRIVLSISEVDKKVPSIGRGVQLTVERRWGSRES